LESASTTISVPGDPSRLLAKARLRLYHRPLSITGKGAVSLYSVFWREYSDITYLCGRFIGPGEPGLSKLRENGKEK
jgi:hypothetical protein